MKQTRIQFEWADMPLEKFRTGVSLHSHTLHSQESLDFIYRLARQQRPVRLLLEQGERQYRKRYGRSLELRRAWWTPPCAPYDAWLLETNQIRQRLGLEALVSLTDHDNIEAPLSLRTLECCSDVPVSFEWTIPYVCTAFHLGVHNLRADRARQLFAEMEAFTRGASKLELTELLQSLSADPGVLIVFNHPCWDEEAIGAERHAELLFYFLRLYGKFIHALELNGLRPWHENRQVFQVAAAFNKPVVSGGDRHTLEANTVLDLTNAGTFCEYVEQVRRGWTNILVTNAYRQRFSLRIFRTLQEILRVDNQHGRGWSRWSDRVFYRCEDGVVRSLSELFPGGTPRFIELFVFCVGLLSHSGVERTFRLVLPEREEFAL